MRGSLPSRDDVLSGALHSSRRTNRIVTAIELRVAYLRTEVRNAIATHFFAGEGAGTADVRSDYLRGLKLSAQSGAESSAWDVEQYVDQWRTLIPANVEARVGLIEEMARRRYLSLDAPRTLAALGCHDEVIRECYQKTYGRPLDSILNQELPAKRDGNDLSTIANSAVWIHLPAGKVLLRQGDPGDSAYILISGRLQLSARDRDGVEREIAHLGSGEIVGEIAPFTGTPRTATARAVRDSKLIEIPGSAVERLVRKQPERLVELSREMVRRIATRSHRVPPPQLVTIAIVPVNEPVNDFTGQLVQALQAQGSTLHLDSKVVRTMFGMDPNEAAADPVDDSRLATWLDAQEASFRYVLYEADVHPSPWTERCMRQADRVLLVASARHQPSPGALSWTHDLDPTRVELVILHPSLVTRPRDTDRWLALRPFRAHHHVREGNAADVRRTARRVTGQALGLVLSGGGARGFAHAGVIRALEEAGIEVDVVGGTSMGAWVGALYAMDGGYQALVEHARVFAGRRQLLDFTLPITSFVAGRKLTDMLQHETDGAGIEDLWRSFYCVSSNLTRAEQVIHRRGPLWRSVRASTALPGIYPPVLESGEVLVDGGLINNFPLDVMRATGEVATVIGVNTTPVVEQATYRFGDSVSGWQQLLGALSRSRDRPTPPTLFSTLTRGLTLGSSNHMRNEEFLALADLIIEPRVSQFGVLDFDQFRSIFDAGYETARPELQRWQRTRGDVS